jgi:hypothetical protein
MINDNHELQPSECFGAARRFRLKTKKEGAAVNVQTVKRSLPVQFDYQPVRG